MKTLSFPRAKGFTIVEILVALLIGLLSVYAVYSVYMRFNSSHRAAASVNETQMAGLYSMFLLEQTLSDAGSAMMHKDVFGKLVRTQSGLSIPGSNNNLADYFANSAFPLPIVIDSQTNSAGLRNDEVWVFTGKSTRYLASMKMQGSSLNNGPNALNIPTPFNQGDILIQTSGGHWASFRVVNSSLTSTALNSLTSSGNPSGGNIVNLGAAVRYRFYVNADNALIMEQYDFGNPTPVSASEIARNVQVFAAQYGVDTNGNNLIDRWLDSTDASATMTWSPDRVLGIESISAAQRGRYIKAVKAIRIGAVFATEEPEHNPEQAAVNLPTQTLFATCSSETQNCPQPITFTPPSQDGSAVVRYRTYEAEIPLHNVIWNPSNAE